MGLRDITHSELQEWSPPLAECFPQTLTPYFYHSDKAEEQIEEEEHEMFWGCGIRAHQVHNPDGKPSMRFGKVRDELADFRMRPVEMAPSVPRTRAAAALRMKQIALDNQSRMIRGLTTKLATKR
ncbi:hypothetical protein F511_34311 [Dorcoceras hygrometricum]|uniref:Uncharacterized protein n=1 Tax=Dorcoceras hygrometricum TaxID=472368 RepID=A0A2Z7DDW9_9LAMI|nr:hypothetical protein F511_34311 [Dorcoceras hygrometricum]